jgi:EC042_2821-lke REase
LEIRDNAVHFINKNAQLKKALAEISMACVRNYVLAAQKWFSVSFDDLNMATIPITFDLDQGGMEAVAKKPSAAVTKFLKHMQSLEADAGGTKSQFSFSINVFYDVQKKKIDGAVPVRVVGPGEDAEMVMMLDENAMPAGYDWSYEDLIKHLRKRYSDFGTTKQFHEINRELQKEKANCITRYLNPKKKVASTTTRFYNPNIVKHFDKHYTLK